MHIVSLSFDDGFKESNEKIAKVYEKFGLSACFNVLAVNIIGNDPDQDQWQPDGSRGDFDQWNALQKRGHEIMPHGLIHNNLSEIPFEEARQSILECLDIFEEKLAGFRRKEAVFNFPYNDSTPELDAWLRTEVRAFRKNGEAINPLPFMGQSALTTTGYGPENCEWHLEEHLVELFSRPSGWLIYNVHGVDGEGWGPIRSIYLENVLNRLTRMVSVSVLPVGTALNLADQIQH